MSDNPTRCTTSLPVDSSRLSNRPTESELMELLQPLVEWQKFGIHLPKMSSAMIEKIDELSTDHQKMALFSEWLKVDSYATWSKVIVALSKANEHTLASKIQENLITTITPVDPYQGTYNQDYTLAETSDDAKKDNKLNGMKTCTKEEKLKELAIPIDTMRGTTVESVPVTAEREKFIKILKGVLHKNFAKLKSTIHDCLPQVAAEMFSKGLLTESVRDMPTYNGIIREFEAGMEYKRTKSQIEKHCQLFLDSLFRQGGPAEGFAQMLAEEWIDEISKQLNITFTLTVYN